MSLTYQPFAEIPQIQELSRELHHNVGSSERAVSGALGAVLWIASSHLHGLSKYSAWIAGGALIARAMTGHCAAYHQLGIDTRHTVNTAA